MNSVSDGMKIFLDFDDTLFCTRDFMVAFKEVFREHGITPDMWKESYDTIKNSQLPGAMRSYEFDRHLAWLREHYAFNEEQLRQQIEDFLQDVRSFLFPDTLPFLEKARLEGYTLYLVSLGAHTFQEKKVIGSGIADYFKKICVHNQDQDKADVIQNIHTGGSGAKSDWFIEDAVKYLDTVKRTLPSIKTMRMDRPERRYVEPVCTSCDYVVHNLEEAEKIIFS